MSLFPPISIEIALLINARHAHPSFVLIKLPFGINEGKMSSLWVDRKRLTPLQLKYHFELVRAPMSMARKMGNTVSCVCRVTLLR